MTKIGLSFLFPFPNLKIGKVSVFTAFKGLFFGRNSFL